MGEAVDDGEYLGRIAFDREHVEVGDVVIKPGTTTPYRVTRAEHSGRFHQELWGRPAR